MIFEPYIEQIPFERKDAFRKLITVLGENLPEGFEAQIQYKMPSFVVPHSIYPQGYHCDPKTPLPFISVASQKNFIAVYHMGIYADEQLLNWFVNEYPLHSRRKLDMGKSCIRFKNTAEIPFDLIAQLAQKMTAQAWIELYEKNYKR